MRASRERQRPDGNHRPGSLRPSGVPASSAGSTPTLSPPPLSSQWTNQRVRPRFARGSPAHAGVPAALPEAPAKRRPSHVEPGATCTRLVPCVIPDTRRKRSSRRERKKTLCFVFEVPEKGRGAVGRQLGASRPRGAGANGTAGASPFKEAEKEAKALGPGEEFEGRGGAVGSHPEKPV